MLTTLSNINKQIVGKVFENNSRQFYKWLIIVFNKVDQQRLEEVGPDRTCAEWLLKNGALVKWKGAKEYINDYNLLPKEHVKYYLQAIDATDSAIHHIGFAHFAYCKHIEEIKLVRCSYIENDAIPLLSYVKDSLKNLEIVECKNLTDEALISLKNLKCLSTLKLGRMPYVENKNSILSQLTEALPNCKITYI